MKNIEEVRDQMVAEVMARGVSLGYEGTRDISGTAVEVGPWVVEVRHAAFFSGTVVTVKSRFQDVVLATALFRHDEQEVRYLPTTMPVPTKVNEVFIVAIDTVTRYTQALHKVVMAA